MTIIRKRQTLNAGEQVVIPFDFAEELGSQTIPAGVNPVATQEVKEGTHSLVIESESSLPVFSQADFDVLPDEEQTQELRDLIGRRVLCKVTAPAGSEYHVWKLTVSIIDSGSWAYSSASLVVGA